MFNRFKNLFGAPSGTPTEFHPTDICPHCGSRLLKSARSEEPKTRGAFPPLPAGEGRGEGESSPKLNGPSPSETEAWSCPNPDCPPQVRARLEHWCSPAAMDIPSGDAAMIEKLLTPGLVRDVSELYRLKVKELAALPGMDQDSAQKFFDALTASLKQDAWRVLFGLAIPQVGAAESKMLCQSFRSLDEIFAAGRERIQKISGVPEPVAHSIAHWYGDAVNRRMVGRLAKAGINFKSANS